MKIATILFDLPSETKGGVAHMGHYLANYLVSAGHNVVVFTTSPKPDDAAYEIRRIKLPRFIKKIYGLKIIVFPVKLCFEDFSSFDIVHSHGDDQFIFAKVPVVRTFHGSGFDEAFSSSTISRFLLDFFYFYPLEILSGLKADASTGVSKSTKKRYPFRIEVVYNSVELDIFKPGPKSNHPVILFVGGALHGRKRGMLLVEIYNKHIKKVFRQAELWLVTGDKIEGEGIRCFNADLTREEMARLYQKAWLLCLPSRYEGFGLPYIEAMASGLAIVTTPNPGALEVLEHGRYGCIADKKYLGRSIIELLKDNKRRLNYERLGVARAKEFSVKVALDKYQKIYKRLHTGPNV